jgi:hypothetical protein
MYCAYFAALTCLMKKIITNLAALLLLTVTLPAQQHNPDRLKVFIDCSSVWCDMQYIRSEINIADFLLDNAAADVHVLITSQGTGGGGDQYQFIFFGQQSFKNQTDTLRFSTSPNATEFEVRAQMLKYLKTGLLPFIAQTASIKNVEINLKSSDTTGARTNNTVKKDKWNAWVMRIGASGNINGDANYKNTSYRGNASADRITEKMKTGVGVYWSRNNASFKYEDNGTIQKLSINNHNWEVTHYLVKSINPHWSWAYDAKYSQATFSNNKGRALLRAAAEYNIFPYSEVNNRLFTLSYGFTARRNSYYDTTIYNKTNETLLGQRATAYLTLNQKWGNSYAGITYHNYFSNWKLFNLSAEVYSSVRITGGLSFYIMTFGGLTRDQIFLVKGNASPEEVLARRRQLASGYSYYTSLGISYRFGSKLNNVVNPRFDRSSSSSDE